MIFCCTRDNHNFGERDKRWRVTSWEPESYHQHLEVYTSFPCCKSLFKSVVMSHPIYIVDTEAFLIYRDTRKFERKKKVWWANGSYVNSPKLRCKNSELNKKWRKIIMYPVKLLGYYWIRKDDFSAYYSYLPPFSWFLFFFSLGLLYMKTHKTDYNFLLFDRSLHGKTTGK